MVAYLAANPPRRSQYRQQRRQWHNGVTWTRDPSGAVVVHTAENAPDYTLPDDGAEAVAAYIVTRTTAGSYHNIVDSDTIVEVGEDEWEMFGDGTGGNRWAWHLSFATHAHLWGHRPDWDAAALTLGARAAARFARRQHANGLPVPPPERITATDYRRGRPGFVSHGQLDPGRRSDPGGAFPWDRFLDLYANELGGDTAPEQETDMITYRDLKAWIDDQYDLVGEKDTSGRVFWATQIAADFADLDHHPSYADLLASPMAITMVAGLTGKL